MLRVGIVGGETHAGAIIKQHGRTLEIVQAAVRKDQVNWAKEHLRCDVITDAEALLARDDLDAVFVANENDRRWDVIEATLRSGRDLIVDKPLVITMDEQEKVEALLRHDPKRRLLMLLTLRGDPLWAGLRNAVRDGRIGTPAHVHVRMAVQLKPEQRPAWFLDVRRSGGLFLDLLIHGLDYVEWMTGHPIVAMAARTGNLGGSDDVNLRDHAAVFCELADGSSAMVEGQRMLPATCGSDYRVTVAGTGGFADLCYGDEQALTFTDAAGAGQILAEPPQGASIVADWIAGGELLDQAASLRANRLALLATAAAEKHRRIDVPAG